MSDVDDRNAEVNPSLSDWMARHPPAHRGVLSPHLPALRQLAAAGYTHQEMRTWLLSQDVRVSRQAITKALASAPTARRPPLGNHPAHRMQGETTGPQPCTPSKNPGAAPPRGHGATLKDRALAVGEKYLGDTLNPLVAQMLAQHSKRKT